MKLTNVKLTHTFFSILLVVAAYLLSARVMAVGVDTTVFIEEAAAKNIAEIELGKLALQQSAIPEVKAFAKKMIEDNASSNKDLRELASKKNVEIADEAALLDKAKNYMLKPRLGESFDTSYINNQIDTHKATIQLFKDASSSTDEDVRRLAATSIPRLEKHLRDAEALVAVVAGANKNLDEKLEYSN